VIFPVFGTQLGNAVINDIRELVDQTKNSRSDCARTTLSVIAASTSGLNVQKEHKKALLAKKLGLPLKRLSLKMSGPGVDFVSCTFILFFKK
jgi:hypothetical protein